MKCLVGLSSLALFSLSSVAPCLAANQLVSPSASQSLPSKTLVSGTTKIVKINISNKIRCVNV